MLKINTKPKHVFEEKLKKYIAEIRTSKTYLEALASKTAKQSEK